MATVINDGAYTVLQMTESSHQLNDYNDEKNIPLKLSQYSFALLAKNTTSSNAVVEFDFLLSDGSVVPMDMIYTNTGSTSEYVKVLGVVDFGYTKTSRTGCVVVRNVTGGTLRLWDFKLLEGLKNPIGAPKPTPVIYTAQDLGGITDGTVTIDDVIDLQTALDGKLATGGKADDSDKLDGKNFDWFLQAGNNRLSADASTINYDCIRPWDVSTATDAPSGALDGLLTTLMWDSALWGVQQYHDFHNNNLYLKSLQNGTWQSTWTKVWSDANFSLSAAGVLDDAHTWTATQTFTKVTPTTLEVLGQTYLRGNLYSLNNAGDGWATAINRNGGYPIFNQGELSGCITSNADTTGDGTGFSVRYLNSSGTDLVSGIPSSIVDVSVMTQAYNASWQTQMLSDWRNNRWFVRTQNNGVWTEADELAQLGKAQTFTKTQTFNPASGYAIDISAGGIDMNNKPIHYLSEAHFNGGSRFRNSSNSYLDLLFEHATAGRLVFKSYTGDVARGAIHFNGNDFGLLDKDSSWAFRCNGTASYIYYNGTTKLTTTNTGVSITGNVSASGVYGSTEVEGNTLGVNNSSSDSGRGLSLYGGASSGIPTYGMMFAGTATFGTHGSVTGNWATYFTMDNTLNRGWIFKNTTTGNVASISNSGDAAFNGNLTTDTLTLGGITSAQVANVRGRVVSDCNHADFRIPGMYGFNSNPANGTGETYGAMIVAANTDTGLQIAGGHSNDDLYFRGWSSWGTTYSSWRRLLHNGNYTSYTVTKTGGGASGTWNIGISGTAANANLLDSLDSSRFQQLSVEKSGTCSAGWVTILETTSGRASGEVWITDGESGDHSFMQLSWYHSYADAGVTVLNSGGHARRLIGARWIFTSADKTYGTWKLQVYNTTSSTYKTVIANLNQSSTAYSQPVSHITPVTQGTPSGYSEHCGFTNLSNTGGYMAAENGHFDTLTGINLTYTGTIKGAEATATSALKYKTILRRESLEQSLANVVAIGSKGTAVGVWKDPAKPQNAHRWFVADEVNQVVPEVVHKDEETGDVESLNYNEMLADAYAAIALLTKRIEDLEGSK